MLVAEEDLELVILLLLVPNNSHVSPFLVSGYILGSNPGVWQSSAALYAQPLQEFLSVVITERCSSDALLLLTAVTMI